MVFDTLLSASGYTLFYLPALSYNPIRFITSLLCVGARIYSHWASNQEFDMNITKVMNRHLMSSVRTYWALMLLTVSLLLAACNGSHAKQPEKKNFVEQGEYIHFELGGEKFKILKAYFRGGSENQIGNPIYAKFWALLPDFEIYEKSKNHYEFVEQRGWGRKLYFKIHLREADRNSVSAIINNHKGAKGHKRFSGRLGKPDEMKYGLEVYRSTGYNFDDYLYRTDGSAIVYLICTGKVMESKKPNHPYCTMMWDLSESVYADATFSKTYLPHWQNILSNMQKIINGQKVRGY